MKKHTGVLLAGFVTLLAAACATNPVTGKRQVILLSEAEEQAIGQQQDLEVRREMGVYADTALQRYVSDIGQRLAASSHRPDLNWSFTVVDSPAINAFALPGGYIYITRGILAYLDDESELAGVLGHEIGHVTARHAAQAYTRQAEASLGLTVLSIFVPGARPFTDLGSSGLGVLFLKYDRNQELESDRLGVEYAAKAGWDPEGVPRFLATLERVDSLSERGVPNWLSTHPDPGSRVERAEPVASKFVSPEATVRNHGDYLQRIEGLEFGDNPKDGVVRGNVFVHPLLRIGVEFPEGWDVINTAEQVLAREPGTTHWMVMQQASPSRARGAAALADFAIADMRRAGYRPVDGAIERVNGLQAYVGTYGGSVNGVGKVIMRAGHVASGRDIYLIAGFAEEDQFLLVDRDLLTAVRSFRELSRDEASKIKPNKVAFYTVKAGDSWQSIAVRQGQGLVNAATLAIMNDRQVYEQPQAGDRIKIVVTG